MRKKINIFLRTLEWGRGVSKSVWSVRMWKCWKLWQPLPKCIKCWYWLKIRAQGNKILKSAAEHCWWLVNNQMIFTCFVNDAFKQNISHNSSSQHLVMNKGNTKISLKIHTLLNNPMDTHFNGVVEILTELN